MGDRLLACGLGIDRNSADGAKVWRNRKSRLIVEITLMKNIDMMISNYRVKIYDQ